MISARPRIYSSFYSKKNTTRSQTCACRRSKLLTLSKTTCSSSSQTGSTMSRAGRTAGRAAGTEPKNQTLETSETVSPRHPNHHPPTHSGRSPTRSRMITILTRQSKTSPKISYQSMKPSSRRSNASHSSEKWETRQCIPSRQQKKRTKSTRRRFWKLTLNNILFPLCTLLSRVTMIKQ